MCAIVGMQSEDYIDISFFKKIMRESMIRGKHATGISYIENNKLKTITEPVSADKFNYPDIKTKLIIGHCRYSTSSIKYNQPISDNNISIAHNGVITQSSPDTWKAIYNCDFITQCDSEIILRMWEKNKHPLKLNGSMSVVMIANNKLQFYRNEERPLYYAVNNNNFYIASSKNILKRCNVKKIIKTEACLHYEIKNNSIHSKKIRKIKKDLQ
tara:strand:+ start:2648 stop:3286 length:639 start_codon:yes stop_codon:yes gene_type:complete